MHRLLIVDDDPSVLQALKERPEWAEIGFEVAGCLESGEEALKWLSKNRADVVLTDIVMCGMSGVELARALWEENSQAYVIFLSGHQEFEYAQRAMAYGVKGYLLKPVRRAELLTTLNELARLLEKEGRPADRAEREIEEGLLARAKMYIRQHMSEEISVGRLAEAMHYSERHFRRQFAAVWKGSVVEFVTAVRIEAAQEMLRTGMDAAQAARAAGYENERYFRKVFKEKTGDLPAVWQSKNRRD